MTGPLDAEGRISVLNVGTKILLKDTMDHYIRTLGDYKTHYAPNMSAALRVFSEHTIHIVITEVNLEDGSAYRFLQSLGGVSSELEDLFVVIALEERSEPLLALVQELEAQSSLIKPFAAADLKSQIDKYKAWKELPKDPWQLMVQEAKLAIREKKFREAEQHFKDALTSAPNHPGPFYRAGLYFMSKPDYGLAEGLLKKAIALKPDYVQAISALGTLYLTRKDLEKAEEYLKKAQAISPLNPDRATDMVRVLVERAMESCRSTLRLDPAALNARFQLAKFMVLQKDYVGGLREFEQLLPQLKDPLRVEAQTFAALCRKLGGLAR